MYKHDNLRTIAQFFSYLIMNLIVINIVLINNFYTINLVHHDEIVTVIERTIVEFDEVDLQHLCVVGGCKEIGFINNKTFIPVPTTGDNFILQLYDYTPPNIIYSSNSLNITDNLNIYIKFDSGLYTIIDTSMLITRISTGYININIMFIILYIIGFSIFEFKSRRKKILELMNTSNVLREKNMQILTENIHHELNTPVAIIQGNVKKLEIEMNSITNVSNVCETCVRNFFFDFDQIYSSIEQIDTVLSRMSNFKNLKYSNGNKNLSNIIGYSSNSMSIYKKANFEIKVDPALSKYKLAGPLKNGDLLNIVSNHFRNSLEANASRIVTQAKYCKVTRTMHLYIIDNGVGLRDRETGLPLDESKYNNIFKPYYTSKDKKGDSIVRESKGFIRDSILKITTAFKKPANVNVRGVGLYLNKELLTEKGGDLVLRETSEDGTVFEIIFPVLPSQELSNKTK